MGFRLFKDINTALLSKLGWLIASGYRSLWADLFRFKYLKFDETLFSHKVRGGASMVWKSIISSREALVQGACFKLGDGLTVNPWRDPWIPWLPKHILITERRN